MLHVEWLTRAMYALREIFLVRTHCSGGDSPLPVFLTALVSKKSVLQVLDVCLLIGHVSRSKDVGHSTPLNLLIAPEV